MFLLAVSACGVSGSTDSQDELGHSSQQIIGGTRTTTDPAVVKITFVENGSSAFCSGSLIGPRTVLTAAHCADPAFTNYQVHLYTWDPSITGFRIQTIAVSSVHRHPYWDRAKLANDVGVLELAQAAPPGLVLHLTPVKLLPSTLVGTPVREVGYGYPSNGDPLAATMIVSGLDDIDVFSGQTGSQICFGDSGGPAFANITGTNDEYIVGVASWVYGSCRNGGASQRVDTELQWIWETARQWEQPSCDYDQQCLVGCAADPDCACQTDGVCNPNCVFPAEDVDCRDCGFNGRCSRIACPQPERDCDPDGTPCSTGVSCLNALCENDWQHGANYCTRACTTDAECGPAGMVCTAGACHYRQKPERTEGEACTSADMCVGFTVCAPSPATGDERCRSICLSDGTCARADEECKTIDTLSFCEKRPAPVVTPAPAAAVTPPEDAPETTAAKHGCAAAPGAPFLLGALWLIRRRRAR